MTRGSSIRRSVAVASVTGCAAGCALTWFDDSSVTWGAVTMVVQPAEVPVGVDRRCVRAAETAWNANERTVAIVSYRIGRARYTQAFSLAEGQAPQVGERVAVQPRSCRLELDRGSGA